LAKDQHLNNLPSGWQKKFDDFTRAQKHKFASINNRLGNGSVCALYEGTCAIKAYMKKWINE